MSGEISIVPGFTLDEVTGERISNQKLNKLVRELMATVDAGAITAREIADGSITEDKLAIDLEAQMTIPDGSITTAKLADLAVTTAKIADGAVTAAKLAGDVQPQVRLDSISKSAPLSVGTGFLDLVAELVVDVGDVLEAWAMIDALNLNHGFEIRESAGDVLDSIVGHPTLAVSPTGSTQSQQVVVHWWFEAHTAGTAKMNVYAEKLATATGTAYYRHLFVRRIGNGRI